MFCTNSVFILITCSIHIFFTYLHLHFFNNLRRFGRHPPASWESGPWRPISPVGGRRTTSPAPKTSSFCSTLGLKVRAYKYLFIYSDLFRNIMFTYYSHAKIKNIIGKYKQYCKLESTYY